MWDRGSDWTFTWRETWLFFFIFQHLAPIKFILFSFSVYIFNGWKFVMLMINKNLSKNFNVCNFFRHWVTRKLRFGKRSNISSPSDSLNDYVWHETLVTSICWWRRLSCRRTRDRRRKCIEKLSRFSNLGESFHVNSTYANP